MVKQNDIFLWKYTVEFNSLLLKVSFKIVRLFYDKFTIKRLTRLVGVILPILF